MATPQALARLHYELIRGLIERGRCPGNAELAAMLNVHEPEVEAVMRELAAIHGLVLHPHVCEPWVIHPFSLTPTLHWIHSEKGSWWAPCIWCALGVTALVGGRASIHTRYGAEADPLVIEVAAGVPVREDVWVHFAIPPARAWDNVHQHCSLVLPFPTEAAIREWCQQYGVPMGQAVPLQQVARLAGEWYGSHASPQWRKWSVAEAQEIFTRAGLDSDFWQLRARIGHF